MRQTAVPLRIEHGPQPVAPSARPPAAMTVLPDSARTRTRPELDALMRLFYSDEGQLGRFEEQSDLPAPYDGLLHHDAHMTVTVEAFHRGPVSVQVLHSVQTETHYSRKILLRRDDGRVVQFGLVRLSRSSVSESVWQAIVSERIPLGRVLIEHQVLRTVRLMSLWRIQPGSDLTKCLELPAPATCYGRTALIYCDDLPAVELLEVLPPVDVVPPPQNGQP